MSGPLNTKILAGRPAIDFIGRDAEAERIFAHARSSSEGMVVLGTPGAGSTELLKQVYDRLFREQQDVVPFYFSIRSTLKSSRDVATAFIDDFVRQLVAFRRQDPGLFRSQVGLDELAELSLAIGGSWIDRLVQDVRKAWTVLDDDGRSFLRGCIAAPLQAAANAERPVVIIDHVHELLNIDGGMAFLGELEDLYADSGIAFVLCGNRRFLHGRLDASRLEVDNLKVQDAARVAEVLAVENKVPTTDETRDLIATQLGRSAVLMRQVIRAARDGGVSLQDFASVEKVYADALFGGSIGRWFDGMFGSACRNPELERRVISMLFDVQVSEIGRVERERWYRRLQVSDTEAESLLDRLNFNELIRLTPVFIEPVGENTALADYIAARFRLANATENRATVFSDSLSAYIKRAPEIMERSYIVRSALGVREVLGAFAGQKVASALVDYGEFSAQLKGVSDDDSLGRLENAPTIALPKIFFTTAASAFYRPLAQIAESERSAIALGFEPSEGAAGEEIVWIAAEVDSKLEASRDLAEIWCDRLEAAALRCNFARFRVWLISPEGFSAEALELLRIRGAYGSSRRQLGLLKRFLNTPSSSLPPLAENEYEMVIPMNGEAELIAAHAVEEIARRHNLDAKSINQLKTALVEACINAAEHSLSPDGKIYQRFRVEDDRVVLTVSNRGLRLAARVPVDEPNEESRRGWGLKLMRRLMDEVTIEDVDDGTRIVMTKFRGEERVSV
ncbi:MAG TPA: ATP-binding protein [Pyrinomonadaceae bacterium]|nr:ATP-binding protein [Pyrinomonadaceae bacterium]